MPPSIVYDIFLSYNRSDFETIETIAKELKQQGLNVFFDQWVLKHGIPWIEHVENAITSCKIAMIFIGPDRLGEWQQNEKFLALNRQKNDPAFKVIPILLPGADLPLDFLLLNTCLDFRKESKISSILTALIAIIKENTPTELLYQSSEQLSSLCPYRGLRFFREEDAHFFFGREKLVQKLETFVCSHPFAVLSGTSGCGK
ncbi:MAG: toll/interleukin-1 receptor domain-containing protein, partial [Chitinophagaceae bacterium]